METKLNFYQAYTIFRLFADINLKREGETPLPFKIGPYRLGELAFWGKKQDYTEKFIAEELKYLKPVLKSQDDEKILYFEIDLKSAERLKSYEMIREYETTVPLFKFVENQILIMLLAIYSRLIGLLDNCLCFLGFSLPPKWLVSEYARLCLMIEEMFDIPGVSFLEEFKKKYRRPLESLENIPEDYDLDWNQFGSREASAELMGKLHEYWIVAGAPKCAVVETIEYVNDFDKKILSYRKKEKRRLNRFLKKLAKKHTPPPGVKLEPMEPFEKILKPPEVSKPGEVEFGDTKGEDPNSKIKIVYKRIREVDTFPVFKNGEEIDSFSLSGHSSQVLQVIVKAKKSLTKQEIYGRVKTPKFKTGRGLEGEKVKGHVKEELIPSFSTYINRINKRLEKFSLKITCTNFRYLISTLN